MFDMLPRPAQANLCGYPEGAGGEGARCAAVALRLRKGRLVSGQKGPMVSRSRSEIISNLCHGRAGQAAAYTLSQRLKAKRTAAIGGVLVFVSVHFECPVGNIWGGRRQSV
jgi:hypothetical protein